MVSKVIKINESQEKLKYPKSIAFIISNEFCERFNFYGMKTILVLYLTRRLGYDDDNATVLFHIFTSLAYFFPLFGAIIADSWLGRFKTILYLSIVYVFGSIFITVGAIPQLQGSATLITVIGLLLIAFGTGGIKPCVSAFGGDQFKIPEQAKQLATFFSLFYMAINAGSLISTSITPILREDVHCFGEQDCFSLAFGVPGALMIISIIIFILGKPFYEIHKPAGNMIVEVSKCIGHAISKRSKEKKRNPRSHWLEYAEDKYGKKLVQDIRILLKVLVLYLPLPVFWALQDQQGSRWTFQATRMIGDVGVFTIKPDQIQVLNPVLIIVFIPLFDYFVYPLLEKIGIRRSLQKLALGMLLAATAFAISALVELKLETTYPTLPKPNEGQLRVYNGMQCKYHFETNFPNQKEFNLDVADVFVDKHIEVSQISYFNYKAVSIAATENALACPDISGNIKIVPGEAMSYLITTEVEENNNNTTGNNIKLLEYVDDPKKPHKGYPSLRILATTTTVRRILLKNIIDNELQTFYTNNTDIQNIFVGNYDMFIDDIGVSSAEFKLGGSYTLVINEKSNVNYIFKNHIIAEPNSVHILWQLPQYIIITCGEIMFSVTGLEFSFTQSPSSMKSVLQASWLLAVAVGNMIVVVVAKINIFESQALEFFLFSALMIVDLAVFVVLAMRYKYIDTNKLDGDDIDIPVVRSQHQSDAKTNGFDNAAFSEM